MAAALASLAVPGLLALLGLLAWNLLAPEPYPNATLSQLSLPESHLRYRRGCLQWALADKAYYTTPQDPSRIIARLKQSGWARNYHYNESVLDETSRRFGPVTVERVNELFVENRSAGARLVSTLKTTVSLGDC